MIEFGKPFSSNYIHYCIYTKGAMGKVRIEPNRNNEETLFLLNPLSIVHIYTVDRYNFPACRKITHNRDKIY